MPFDCGHLCNNRAHGFCEVSSDILLNFAKVFLVVHSTVSSCILHELIDKGISNRLRLLKESSALQESLLYRFPLCPLSFSLTNAGQIKTTRDSFLLNDCQ